ncbi:hypothetical protein K435DRAFT_811910 [Dendrothele bispora CBS 962.96]|uniref:Uncharacterized protein n=1 Tax=Dendrothele bispora (strain CBS 962.96) TaxID=1314807 RepID=A0A4S8KRP3_DENBC|nr:hypothetical protein K435DRAFT_811910 [Dendrothele bispora CBS 962.96]
MVAVLGKGRETYLVLSDPTMLKLLTAAPMNLTSTLIAYTVLLTVLIHLRGWASQPDSFLYALFIAIDACFRLKRKLVSSIERDPPLQPGWAYFVDPERYRQYLLTQTNQDEMSTCTGLAALDYANTKFSKGYAATGVGHLQKGESRLKNLLEDVRYELDETLVKFVIPKLHIYGHKLACQTKFSLNYTSGVGRTDAEGIECTWANMGPVASSTKEMGPGAHSDTLEDHWGHWNWGKLVGLGELLRRRMEIAMEEMKSQEDAFTDFSTQHIEQVPEWKKMVEDFEDNPHDAVNPFELLKTGLGLQEIRLQLEKEDGQDRDYQIEDSSDDSSSEEAVPIGRKEVGHIEFVLIGLEIEEHQRQLNYQINSKRDPTAKEKANFMESRNRLSRKITRFRSLQSKHTPESLQSLALLPMVDSNGSLLPASNAEDISLFLPSDLTHQNLNNLEKYQHIESRLREGQCQDVLDQLRNDLLVKSRIYTYKKSNARNQGATTRTHARLNRHEKKIKMSTLKYQQAWKALVRLSGGLKELVSWPELRQADVRMMRDAEDAGTRAKRNLDAAKLRLTSRRGIAAESGDESGNEKDEGEEDWEEDWEDDVAEGSLKRKRKPEDAEGFRTMSWIWMGASSNAMATDQLLHAGLRVEWCKAYSRVRRWREEVKLLGEEMRRSLVTLKYFTDQWVGRAVVPEFEGPQAEGAAAYAYEQAAVYRSICGRFQHLWSRDADGSFHKIVRLSEYQDDSNSDFMDVDDGEEDGEDDGEDGSEDGSEEGDNKGDEDLDEEDLDELAIAGKYSSVPI